MHAVTVVGRDWRGDTLRGLLETRGIDTERMRSSANRSTSAYIKPMLSGYESETEDARFDFENTSRPCEADEEQLKADVQAIAGAAGAVIVCDQVNMGIMFWDIVDYLGFHGIMFLICNAQMLFQCINKMLF